MVTPRGPILRENAGAEDPGPLTGRFLGRTLHSTRGRIRQVAAVQLVEAGVPLRILLHIEPRMLAGLIHSELGSESDVEVRVSDTRRPLTEVVQEFAPNVVITNARGGVLSAEIRELMARRTELVAVGIEPHDDHHPVTLFAAGATLPLGELSPGLLCRAIRSDTPGRP